MEERLALTGKLDDVEEQIRMLVSNLQIGPEEEIRHTKIRQSLEQWLSVKYPGCRLKPFGSVVSGLSSRTSDLDIYLDLPQSNIMNPLKIFLKLVSYQTTG